MAKAQAELKKAKDENLVALARDGETRAFDELVTRYQSKIYRLARRMTETEEDAEDVLQEAFVKAYRSLGGFKGESRFSTWLYRITVNLALMKLRKRKLETVPLDQPIETRDGMVQRDIEDAGLDPLERMIAAESRAVLDGAVAELPAEHRAVFVLRDVEKLSTEDTARVLGITVPAVKSRLHRTRLMLKERLLRAAAAKGYVSARRGAEDEGGEDEGREEGEGNGEAREAGGAEGENAGRATARETRARKTHPKAGG